jgi:DNA-binding MarR family transcriptional regulator
MDYAGLPLSTPLSQALVAFTIEFDNEFEHRMPHRTTNHGGTPYAPWLVSLAMWSNCMAFVGEDGVGLDELENLARTSTNLNGMVRWGYIVVGPGKTVRATLAGRKAQDTWRPLFGEIEERWQKRFGKREIDELRKSLLALVSQIDLDLPDCLPILGYGLFSKIWDRARRAPLGPDLALSALLSRALLAFAVEFEGESELSLAICANVLRVLDERGVRVRDIPLLSGVSKESIAMAMGILRKQGIAVVEKNIAGLTPKGREAQDAYRLRMGIIEERWRARFGEETIRTLRDLFRRLVGELFRGLEPYPDGWRASVRKPDTLPHYPMVLHRGGFPDGS